MRICSLLISSSLLVIGCGKGSDPTPNPMPITQPTGGASPQTAAQVFATRCVPCHGSTGNGDGVASATLNPKPRKFNDGAWQTSVTDEYIEKIIKFGGAAVGKSPAMPNNPDLSDQTVISGLKDIVRGFKK
ncbi:MAG: c-type cytochrome [Proteobacteria bacterium]|nr:c-type cytochrome [Pseudomonadota bacterium]